MSKERKATETIFSNDDVIISMADIHHIEKLKTPNGILVILKGTKYNFEHDVWENAIWLGEPESQNLIRAWCFYRSEIDPVIREPEDEQSKERGNE